MRKIIGTLSLLFILPTSGLGQTLPFRTYSIEQGLSEAVVVDLMQDNQGYIWVATNYGLNRFDGIQFKNYFQKDGLLSNKIYSLYQDSSGTIWVGTGNGVNAIQDDSIRAPKALQPLRGSTILDMTQSCDGTYWFAADGKGVWGLNMTKKLTHYTIKNGLASNNVNAISVEPNAILWFGTNGGLTRLNQKTGEIRSFTIQDGLPGNMILDLQFSRKDKALWIATDNGLSLYKNGRFKNYTEKEGLAGNKVHSLTEAPDGSLWIGTEKGVSHLKNGQFTNFTTKQGLPNNTIYATMMGREQNIWFGTFGSGIGVYLHIPVANYSKKQGLPNSVVSGITQDSKGNIWVSTDGGGIARLQNGRFNKVINRRDGLISNGVYDIAATPYNQLLIGTRQGISIYHNGKFTNYKEPRLPFDKIKTVVPGDGPQKFWMGTYGKGIIEFDHGQFKQFGKKDGLSNNIILDLQKGSDGALWIASYGGVSRFKNGHFTNYTIKDGLPSNGVLDITKANDGALWFATFGGIVEFKNHQFISITPKDGLPDEVCYFIIQDNKGYFWIGTTRGVIRFSYKKYKRADTKAQKEAAFKLYTQEQGLIANEMNAAAAFKDRQGNLWFGSVNGLMRFDPAHEVEHSVPPLIHITGVTAADREIRRPKNLHIPSDNRNITISFVGLNYSAPRQLTYQYRLKGSGESWQQTSQRSIHYSALVPGRYTFQVKAKNGDAVWSKQAATFSFRVLAPFWRHWWFLLLMALLVAGAIFFIYRYYRVRRMVDIERMRVRIASDLHDDVGSSLTEIALQSDFLQTMHETSDDLKESLQSIGAQSRKIVSNLDDIVWTIDARNDTLGDLTDRMQDYVNHTLADRRVIYHFNRLKTDREVSVSMRENLYLIFKEAVNNIARHSNADKIDIFLTSNGDSYRMEIADNGTGLTGKRKSGHGLRNMKMRGKRIDANVIFENKNGFTVIVEGKRK
jgi:ligand-binding sensor domain-containing protein/signal transduction histidine kinase